MNTICGPFFDPKNLGPEAANNLRTQRESRRRVAFAEGPQKPHSSARGRNMRKLFVTLAVVGGLWFVVSRTSLASYARTLWSVARTEVKNQVPTRFEMERVRTELAGLDGDIQKMIRPIAEYMASIGTLKKDIVRTRENLEEQRTVLLTMARDLEANPSFVVYRGEKFDAERVRAKLERDFASFRRLEDNLNTQRKLLQAKETSLRATQEQLGKLVAKKREYELRLAGLEAQEETLQVARLGTNLRVDDSRATQIEAALADIERRQEIQRAEIELLTGDLAGELIPVPSRSRPEVDPATVRRYLESPETSTAGR